MADTLGAISPTSRAAARRARPGSSFPGLGCQPLRRAGYHAMVSYWGCVVLQEIFGFTPK